MALLGKTRASEDSQSQIGGKVVVNAAGCFSCLLVFTG